MLSVVMEAKTAVSSIVRVRGDGVTRSWEECLGPKMDAAINGLSLDPTADSKKGSIKISVTGVAQGTFDRQHVLDAKVVGIKHPILVAPFDTVAIDAGGDDVILYITTMRDSR